MKHAGQKWASMSEKERQPFVNLSNEDKQRRESQLKEMKEKGFFVMEDGSKSSEHKAKVY